MTVTPDPTTAPPDQDPTEDPGDPSEAVTLVADTPQAPDAQVLDAQAMAAKILGAQDREVTDPIPVPEWGVEVVLVEPDAEQRTRFSLWAAENGGGRDVMFPVMLAFTLCHPDTLEPLFTLEDVQALNRKNGKVVHQLGLRALRIAGMDDEAVEAGKDDSPPTPTAGSSTS